MKVVRRTILQKLYRNRQKKVVSCVNGCLTRYDAVFHGSILYKALIEISLNHQLFRLSSYLVWVGVKFSNAKEEELLINDASQIGSKKFDFSIE